MMNHHRNQTHTYRSSLHRPRHVREPLGAASRIYATEPSAAEQLIEKLQTLRARQGLMTRANTLLRRNDRQELVELGLPSSEIARLSAPGAGGRVGYSEHEIRANAASIRRVEVRLKELEQRATRVSVRIQSPTFTYVENVDDGKVLFEFLQRPCAESRQVLADYGFKLSAVRRAYVRPMTSPALAAAKCVRRRLEEIAAAC